MKKYLSKILLFFILIAAVDIASGMFFSYVASNTKAGSTGRMNYIVDNTKEDILVFGSSRAERHYNPSIIEDSLGLSAYNCGQSGMGIISNYAIFKLIQEHYSPRLIIYDVTPSFDLFKGEDNHKYLSNIRRFYDRDVVRPVFENVDVTEKYKMISQMYRYNSKFTGIIHDYILVASTKKQNGFTPLADEMNRMKISVKGGERGFTLDTLKIHYMRKFLEESKKRSNVVLVSSPLWYGLDSLQLRPIEDLCKEYNVLFLCFSNSPKYVHQDCYFKDGGHLNFRGADEFTRDLICELKQLHVIE